MKGKLYLVGGRNVTNGLITSIDVYDPLKDMWTTPFHWPQATSDPVAFAVNDLLYVAGGYDNAYNTYGNLSSLNVTNGHWDYDYPAMPTGRGDIRVETLDKINFYVIGGFSAPNFCVPSAAVEVYNVKTRKWRAVSPMLVPRGDVSVGVLGDNIFAIGGETIAADCLHSIPVSFVSRYTVQTDVWVKEASSPEDLFRYTSAAYNTSTSPHSRAIYLFGGQGRFVGNDTDAGYYPIMSSTIKYVPVSSSSGQAAPAKLNGGDIAGIVIGGLVFLALVTLLVLFAIYYREVT